MAFLAAAAPFLSIAGTAVSALGSIQQGAYGAEVARNNAKIATQNAEYSRQRGQQEAATQSRKGAVKGAQIKTAQAASGIDISTGSAVDVQQGEAMVSKLDVETVLNNAELQAYGYTTQATSFEAQAQQDETAGFIGAAGSLLQGASSLGTKWGQPTPTGTVGANWATQARQSAFGARGPFG